MIPHYGDKYDAEALYDPAESVAPGDGPPDVPPAVVLGFRETLGEAARARGDEIDPQPARELAYYRLSESVAYCPVEAVGVGAPVSACRSTGANASVTVRSSPG